MKKNHYAASKYWQCSECSKWRYVGKEPCPHWNPDTWRCRDNLYQPQNSCEGRDAFENVGVPVYLKCGLGEQIQGQIFKLNVPKDEASEGKYPFLAISCACKRCTTKFSALPDNMWQGIRWYQDHCKDKSRQQRWTTLVTYVRFDGTSSPISEWLKFNADKWGMTHNSKCTMSVNSATVLPRIKPTNMLPSTQSSEVTPSNRLPAGVRIANINDPSMLSLGMRTVQTPPIYRNSSRSPKQKSFDLQRWGDTGERPLKRHKMQSVRDLEQSVINYQRVDTSQRLDLVKAEDPQTQIEVIQAQQDILNSTTQLQAEAILRAQEQLQQIDAQMDQNELLIQLAQQQIQSAQQNLLSLTDQKLAIQSSLSHLHQHKSILKDTSEVMQSQLTTLQNQVNSDSSPPQSTLQVGIQINTQNPTSEQTQGPQLEQHTRTADVDQEINSNLQQNTFNNNNLLNGQSEFSQLQQNQSLSGIEVKQQNEELQNGAVEQQGNLLHGIGSCLLVTMLMDAAQGVDCKDEKSCSRTILSPLLLHGLLQ